MTHEIGGLLGRLDGVLRYGTKHGWHVQVVERAFHKVDVRETLKFWNPDGIIAECGIGVGELNRRAFGKLPVVYFDRDPKLCKGEMAVLLDSEEVGRMAAKELLSLELDNYAFVPFRLPMYWGEERARALDGTELKLITVLSTWPFVFFYGIIFSHPHERMWEGRL